MCRLPRSMRRPSPWRPDRWNRFGFLKPTCHWRDIYTSVLVDPKRVQEVLLEAVPATADWAYYPSTAAVVAKIEATTPGWKWPVWWWTKRFGGWPFSAEWLSAAFDANVAPFYQSFIEVRVKPSKGRVRLLPYGVHGRIHWGEMGVSPGARPSDARPDSPVEWVVEMCRER